MAFSLNALVVVALIATPVAVSPARPQSSDQQLASGAGQITANVLNPCVAWYEGVPEAMITSGVIGGIAGGAGWWIRQWLRPATQPIERHHLLPRQFRAYFEQRGLNIDAPEFIVELPRDAHRLRPNGLHTGPDNWNALWRRFIEANPNASQVKILEYLEWMKGVFGLR